MQNHIVPYFLDVGQHMEQVPLLSPGLFRHVTWALILRFSAQGENWSICAKLAFVPMQFFHQQSQSIVPSINMYTIHKHTVTDKHSKTHTHTQFTSVLFRSPSLCCLLFRPPCFRPFLIVIMLFN